MPPSTVRRIVPSLPPAQTTFWLTTDSPRRLAVEVGVVSRSHDRLYVGRAVAALGSALAGVAARATTVARAAVATRRRDVVVMTLEPATRRTVAGAGGAVLSEPDHDVLTDCLDHSRTARPLEPVSLAVAIE